MQAWHQDSLATAALRLWGEVERAQRACLTGRQRAALVARYVDNVPTGDYAARIGTGLHAALAMESSAVAAVANQIRKRQ
ncbi:MAG TPA: hypothetical protein VM074_07120 [Solimonas sp.]|nr:hypothetical protein [Solimonas sp.]